MRTDMFEVIIERPRWGHDLRYPRRRVRSRTFSARGALDEAPIREPVGGFYRDKQLSENLSPLVRFLRSNPGRRWDKVRSEIAAHLSVGSAVQKHVMDHVKDYVMEHVRRSPDGRWIGAGRWSGQPSSPRWFFVHPRTGILLEVPPVPRKARARERVADPDRKVLSATRELHRLEGIWYEVTLAPLPPSYGRLSTERVRDAVARIDPGRHPRPETARVESMTPLWQTGRYATAIRQLSRREIRQLLG